ncbi:PREDICTED: uncharacterized protein LOC108374526 isoform X2 [Rhagoletis zephyria]|uniref:uncharacterized protein LOC108374526 isoform X2 n=1 Tax=Rhagoletis zephyria TaxID=28612 RepID=UPI0008119DF1|nr:PREDICTED: uncharacterized protein LOC108374526 isoform X2 [Rhagoletis zephyria]
MISLTANTIRLQSFLCLVLHINIVFYHISATPQSSLNEFMGTERPYFDDVNPRNISTVADEPAILRCRVKNKGNRTVSWMRKRDLHILTTNIYTYTGDQRFSVVHPPGSDDWDLKIEYAQQRDSGIYECQVNTEPKINLAVSLVVNAARAKILGSTEIHVKRDSTIALACSVNIHASSVSWYHGSSVVDFDSQRGGISLETEKTDVGTTSRLMLTRASLRDSGNYTCAPIGAVPASVRVHVLTGEQPAAMQTGTADSVFIESPAYLIIAAVFIAAWNQYLIISQTTSSYANCNLYQRRPKFPLM